MSDHWPLVSGRAGRCGTYGWPTWAQLHESHQCVVRVSSIPPQFCLRPKIPLGQSFWLFARVIIPLEQALDSLVSTLCPLSSVDTVHCTSLVSCVHISPKPIPMCPPAGPTQVPCCVEKDNLWDLLTQPAITIIVLKLGNIQN